MPPTLSDLKIRSDAGVNGLITAPPQAPLLTEFRGMCKEFVRAEAVQPSEVEFERCVPAGALGSMPTQPECLLVC